MTTQYTNSDELNPTVEAVIEAENYTPEQAELFYALMEAGDNLYAAYLDNDEAEIAALETYIEHLEAALFPQA